MASMVPAKARARLPAVESELKSMGMRYRTCAPSDDPIRYAPASCVVTISRQRRWFPSFMRLPSFDDFVVAVDRAGDLVANARRHAVP